ncbi:hypothetical protein HOLleu_01268 [Holothuria leucospilota]|uniref:Uncharacterized protein n=1 Tax=Holothuria leucospilota TaxID=206669 RepID=A0A9Q1CNT4_HOLLE|nr:hypothetical protein HOLleu_01268 [Holothuria leucospilota]
MASKFVDAEEALAYFHTLRLVEGNDATEPTELESRLRLDRELAAMEMLDDRVRPEPVISPPGEHVEATAARNPKRRRGRPRKQAAVVEAQGPPPPMSEGPATPPPLLTEVQVDEYNARVEARAVELANFSKIKKPPEAHHLRRLQI